MCKSLSRRVDFEDKREAALQQLAEAHLMTLSLGQVPPLGLKPNVKVLSRTASKIHSLLERFTLVALPSLNYGL